MKTNFFSTKKRIRFSVFICLALNLTLFAQPPGGNSNRWEIHFADEFNTAANSSPDEDIWFVRQQKAFKKNQISVKKEGGLSYMQIRNNYPSVGDARGAWIQSKADFGPGGKAKHGYYEARIRVRGINNTNKGMIWPTWWIWGGNQGGSSTEFDLMEYSGFAEKFSDGFATTSHHFRRIEVNGRTDVTSRKDCNKNRNNREWHRWGMYWGETDVVFYYDGIPYFSSPRQGVDIANSGSKPLQLILSSTPHTRADVNNNNKGFPNQAQICGNCTGFQANNDPAFAARPGTNLPTFEIDWVRVWRDKNTNAGAPGDLSRIDCAGSTINGANQPNNRPVANIANGTYFIQNPGGNIRINSPSGRTVNTANTSANSAKWQFTKVNNYYTIKNLRNNEFLEVPYAACNKNEKQQNPNINLGTWTQDIGSHQRWNITKVGDNFFLQPLHCNKVVDRNNGNPMHLWPYIAGNNNQTWRIVSTSGNTGGNSSGAPINKVITIKPVKASWINNTFDNLSARFDENGIVRPNVNGSGEWEKFVVENGSNGNVRVKVKNFGAGYRYLLVNGENISATGTSATANAAQFKWVSVGSNTFGLQSVLTNKYVQIPQNQNKNTAILNVKGALRGDWELFSYNEIGTAKNIFNDKDENITSTISLFPNPVKSGQDVFIGRNLEAINVKVYNINGSVVLQSNTSKLNTQELSTGLYFVDVTSKNRHKILKLIIE